MSKNELIKTLEKSQHKNDGRGQFRVGDTIRVHTLIKEGQKERTQVFMGTVIARKGSGLSETFSVHRVAYGEGMERVFLLNSPRISKIEVMQEGDVRRAKLYHLRGTQGKKARVKKRVGPMRQKSAPEAEIAKDEPALEKETSAAVEGATAAEESEGKPNEQPQAEASTPEEETVEKAPASAAE